MQGETS